MSVPPRVYRAEVLRRDLVTAGMLRLTLGGREMRDFPTTGVGDEYVRLFLPDRPGEEPRIPFATEHGWDYPAGVEPSTMRTYTIRAHRPGEVDIDFVLHEGGRAPEWARSARVGDAVGVNTPFLLYERPARARSQVLVADATGLPAVGRIVASTPADVATIVLCEVEQPDHVQRLDGPGGVRVTWSSRTGNGLGPSRLVELLRELDVAADGSCYVWAAGEAAMTRAVRRHLRRDLRLPADAYKTVGYWVDESPERSAQAVAQSAAAR